MDTARRIPSADAVLRAFFDERRAALSGRRLERLRRAEEDLRACLDELAPHLLTDQELALLALERQFEPEGAAARVTDADAVLLVLPVFLDAARWHGDDLEDRRIRIRLAEPLAATVVRLPAFRGRPLSGGAWTVEAAVRHAVWTLRLEREATRRS